MSIGPVSFLPFNHDDAREKINDEKICQFLKKYFQSYVDICLEEVNTVTLVFNGELDFIPSDQNRSVIRKSVDALIFNAIAGTMVNAISNRSMGPPSSEAYQLYFKNFRPDDEYLGYRAGSTTHGGLRIGEVKFTKPLSTGGFFLTEDRALLDGLASLLGVPKNMEFMERIFRCLEWFRYAHADNDEVSPLSKIVMMATAFEIALDVPEKERNKQKFIAEYIERLIYCCDLSKSERCLGKTNVVHTNVGWWARDFYTLRNGIVHGDKVEEINIQYDETNINWMDHLIMADLMLYYCIKKLLLYNTAWGESRRARLRETQRTQFPDWEGYVKVMEDVPNGPNRTFRDLGWLARPEIRNTPGPDVNQKIRDILDSLKK
ncbi:MAG TPA: hypothetical protein VM658_18895 [bacterium]|nr:hypothetical protein [bacterium]